MAETTNPAGGPSVKAIRSAMAKTRASLGEKLSELKERLTLSHSAPTKRKTTMATKKAAAKAAPKAAKKPAAKKTTSIMKSKPVQAAKKTAGKVAKKTKE